MCAFHRCHISTTVKAEAFCLHLKTPIVPGGCMKYIQAPHVLWNTAFKTIIMMHGWLTELVTNLHVF